jgi:N-acetyl sugar amidotransferase
MTTQPYLICTKTVMDTSDPSISFDSDGISNHYWDFHNIVKPQWHCGNFGRVQLESLSLKLKRAGRGRDFDCIIGLSGGADSSYMLHRMVTDYGIRPLVFHVDAGWNSEIAVSNINALIDGLGLDLFTEVINWNEMRDYQLAMFMSGVPHLDVPQDLAFIGVLYKYAAKYGVKHILNGGNISTESVLMPLKYLYWPTDLRQARHILSMYGTVPMKTFPFSSVFYHKFYLRYLRGVQVHKPLNCMPYVKTDAMAELQAVYGWKPYPQKHFESRFTRFFEGYWLPTRFGYDMRRNQFSSLILSGQMTRDQALEQLALPSYDPYTIDHDFAYIATKLGISTSQLRHYHEMPKKYYWNYKNLSSVFHYGEKLLSLIAKTRRGGAY